MAKGDQKRKPRERRPWKVPRAPEPREWVGANDPRTGRSSFVSSLLVPSEIPGALGVELQLLRRELRTWVGESSEDGQRRRRKGSRVVADRRADALAEAPPRIRPSLGVLMEISKAHPPPHDALQGACLEVVEWAQEAGYAMVAVDFAESCSGIVTEQAVWEARRDKEVKTLLTGAWGAFVAARTNRIAGEPWRAEVFYARAIRFSRWAAEAAPKKTPERSRAWSIYVRAHLGYGRLHAKHGRYRAASKHYRAAARRAYIEGEEWLSAQTYHDTLALLLEEGLLASVAGKKPANFDEARIQGRRALERYPRHHERFPAAVHDFVFLLVCEHHYSDALPLLELLIQAPIPHHDQVIGWSTLARAAGSLGDRDRYADAEASVLELSPHYELHAPSAMVNLAFGARALGDWQLAEQYVTRGIALAESCGHKLAVQIGKNLHREIIARIPAPPPVPPLVGEEAKELRELAASVAEQLASWRGPTWTKKESQHGLASLGAV